MEHKNRECSIRMSLKPSAGWQNLYVDFGEGEWMFPISSILCDGFEALLRALYFLHPANYEERDDFVYEYVTEDNRHVLRAEVEWDGEGAWATWILERDVEAAANFRVHLHIEIKYREERVCDYDFLYEELCYAAAKAYTDALKGFGFLGYYASTYGDDFNVRYLVFLKAAALGKLDACKLTPTEDGYGDTSDFDSELELLLVDM
ncbi:MAG: hypothetical protein IKF50_04365 [Clostridia bacterium]|nr:hypothetical protein [Clostridia bacterium]